MQSQLLSVTVIIPVHKITEAFSLCIASVLNALQPDDEVIVEGDGLASKAFEFLTDRSQIKVFVNNKISGPAATRNFGANSAKGNILFFIDSDVTIKPDTIKKIVSVFQYKRDVSAIIGSYDDEPQIKILFRSIRI